MRPCTASCAVNRSWLDDVGDKPITVAERVSTTYFQVDIRAKPNYLYCDGDID